MLPNSSIRRAVSYLETWPFGPYLLIPRLPGTMSMNVRSRSFQFLELIEAISSVARFYAAPAFIDEPASPVRSWTTKDTMDDPFRISLSCRPFRLGR